MTIVEFLLARIAEDEQDIATARLDDEPEWWMPEQWTRSRALAECVAKRQIVALHNDMLKQELGNGDASAFGAGLMHLDVLRSLASVYADHPDYREEWRA